MRKLPLTSRLGKSERDSSAEAWVAGNRPLARPCVARDPSDTGTRIFDEGGSSRVSYSPASCVDDVVSDGHNSQEIFAEDGPRVRLAGSDLIEGSRLIFEDRVVPAPREKRRIRSEQQPMGPRDFQRMPENLTHGEMPGLVTDPVIGAGRVQIDVRALVGQHQGLPKEARAEVRHDDLSLIHIS